MDSVIGSKEWGNRKVSYFTREILYADTWIRFPFYKILVVKSAIKDLEFYGLWWQAERLRNHLHRWMKKQGLEFTTLKASISSDKEEEDPSS